MGVSVHPGPPTDHLTTMGAIISKRRHDSIMRLIESGKEQGGGRPADPALDGGYFIAPTVFADVTPAGRRRIRVDQHGGFALFGRAIRWREAVRN